MKRMPRDKSLESTASFIRDPYRFISERCERYGTDLFEARILLRRTICMRGQEAARVFYDTGRFERRGAAPAALQKTLFGVGAVQGLDGAAHRHRKQIFLQATTPKHVAALVQITERWWRSYIQRWAAMDEVVLYHEMHELLTQAACEWAGIPLEPAEVHLRVEQVTPLFDAAGAVGPRHWVSRQARRRANQWMAGIIEDIRTHALAPPEHAPAHIVAWHRDLQGELLDPHTAAVELLNIVRPVVAVSAYIAFVALALHTHPESRARLMAGDDEYATGFVQEVRRLYPFFPAVAAVVRHDFEWRGYRFAAGRRVLLDLYGTNHDERLWDEPQAFRPERFAHRVEDPFDFVPQGGGDREVDHRCPGEPIAVELMKLALRLLTGEMTYEVPKQDLRIDFARLPALPHSRFVMRRVGDRGRDRAH